MIVLKTNKDLIESILTDYKESRDSDEGLTTLVWSIQLGSLGYGIGQMSCLDFMDVLASKKITNPESIRRTRQKLQQDKPELRGDKYQARHQHQDDVVEELRTFHYG